MTITRLNRRHFLAAGLAAGTSALAGCTSVPEAAPPAASVKSNGAGRLTMHAIDIWTGLPASGMRVSLSMLDGSTYRPIRTFNTNQGGRTDAPLFEGETFLRGSYELLLDVEPHYAKLNTALPRPSFLTEVPIRFSIDDPRQRYHIAILLTPWSYSYYRGS